MFADVLTNYLFSNTKEDSSIQIMDCWTPWKCEQKNTD